MPKNPKDIAASTRIDLSLFPASARAYGALAFVEGDLKYGAYNWRKRDVQASTYYAANGRHMDKWFNGEEVDPDTKVPHLASALASVAVLIDATVRGNLIDDRPPAESAELYKQISDIVSHLQGLIPRQAERFTEKND